jgi:hypothetical protein
VAPTSHRLARIAGAAGGLLLFGAFMRWFPPSSWSQIPFSGDWPPLFQGTIDDVGLLRHAAFSGWRWEFLGGYPIADDGLQGLAAWVALPALLFGPAAGFHAAHLLLVAAIPVLAWALVRFHPSADRDVAWTAAGIAAVLAIVSLPAVVSGGGTNALAGAVAAVAALAAARACRASLGGHAAPLALVAALTLSTFGHPATLLIALVLIVVDAAIARDPGSRVRVMVALAAALVAGLPVTWDLWRAPSQALVNLPPWPPALAAASLLPMLAAPPLAWSIVRSRRLRIPALLVIVLFGLKIGGALAAVPHVRSVREFEPGLIGRVAAVDADLVMIESAFASGAPFPAHFEALVPGASGKRLFGGMWRERMPLAPESAAVLDRDFGRWGVRDVFAWSKPATRYLDTSPLFDLVEDSGRWQHYVFSRPPLSPGPGRLASYQPLGGSVRLTRAQRGEIVTVRTHYDSAWRARLDRQAVPVFEVDGQLAFIAPRDGDYDVELFYPRRWWLIPSAIAAAILGAMIIRLLRSAPGDATS